MVTQSATRPKSKIDNLYEKANSDTGPYCIIIQFVTEKQCQHWPFKSKKIAVALVTLASMSIISPSIKRKALALLTHKRLTQK
jgi:hypothetical protein